jgi:hypothetical protein
MHTKLWRVSAVGAAVSAALLLGAARSETSAVMSASCRGPDSFSAFFLDHLKMINASADSADVSLRAVRQLPQVQDSTITLALADSLCARAVQAYRAGGAGADSRTEAVHLFRVGARYVASDSAVDAGEFRVHKTLDANFAVLATFFQ